MKGEFVVLIGKELYEYDDFDDIPLEFDNVIRFRPEYPPGPHTQEQHDYIDTFCDKLRELMKRERM